MHELFLFARRARLKIWPIAVLYPSCLLFPKLWSRQYTSSYMITYSSTKCEVLISVVFLSLTPLSMLPCVLRTIYDLRKLLIPSTTTCFWTSYSVQLGVEDPQLDWFRKYLHNLNEVVEFLGVSCSPEAVMVGVSQGSILEPLLFNLHLNDLPAVLVQCSMLMYAGDTVLFFSGPQASSIEQTLNRDLRGKSFRW